MAIAKTSLVEERSQVVPTTMMAAVYRGVDDVRMETVAVPEIGPREMLVRVHTCGICGTDLKKISTGSHSAPRIFGHETSGVVARVGSAVDRFRVGDRVMKGIEGLKLQRDETVLVIGQGPIGIILGVLGRRAGARVITSDLYPERLKIAASFGLDESFEASCVDVVESVRTVTEGRGADATILAVGGSKLIPVAMRCCSIAPSSGCFISPACNNARMRKEAILNWS